jgi:hypothetical protein
MLFVDGWPFIAAGRGVGLAPGERACQLALELLLQALFNAGVPFFLVATGAGWDTLVAMLNTKAQGSSALVSCPVDIGAASERRDVHVIVYSTAIFGARFFVKCPHFSVWPEHRASIVASLVCLFELAGQPVAAADVVALLRS